MTQTNPNPALISQGYAKCYTAPFSCVFLIAYEYFIHAVVWSDGVDKRVYFVIKALYTSRTQPYLIWYSAINPFVYNMGLLSGTHMCPT